MGHTTGRMTPGSFNRKVKLHIPKPPKPEFSIVFERRGMPINCILRLEEFPNFCTLTKDSNVLLQIPFENVILPLKINENSVKLTNYATITFPNSRYTLLFKSTVEDNFNNYNLLEYKSSEDDEVCSDSTKDSEFMPISNKLLNISPSFANRNQVNIKEIVCANIPIFISGTFESDSNLCFNEIRDRNDRELVIIKIEWKISNSIGDSKQFDEVVSVKNTLKLENSMIGKFIKLSICWAEEEQFNKFSETKEESPTLLVYKQSVVKGPIIPNQNIARDIMIHSLSDSIAFNALLYDQDKDECKYSQVELVFNQKLICINKLDRMGDPVTLSIDKIKISMDSFVITLSEVDLGKMINLHMNDLDSATLLFHVIIFRKYREKYKILAKWERDLSVGLYSDFNRIYGKILKYEQFLM